MIATCEAARAYIANSSVIPKNKRSISSSLPIDIMCIRKDEVANSQYHRNDAFALPVGQREMSWHAKVYLGVCFKLVFTFPDYSQQAKSNARSSAMQVTLLYIVRLHYRDRLDPPSRAKV